MFRLKENEPEARERLKSFWMGKSIGRPAIAAYSRVGAYEPEKWTGAGLSKKQLNLNPEWYALNAKNSLLSRKFLCEAMPSATAGYGSLLSLLAALAGGDFEYGSDGSAWISPLESVLEKKVPKFDPECETVKAIEKILDKLAGTVGDLGFVSPPPLLDAMTTLSMFMEPGELCVALIGEPEKVKNWTREATKIYIDCYEHFYRYLNGKGYTDTTTWLPAMAESRMEAVQCDFSVMLSPEMFDEFVLADSRRVTSYMDCSIWHHDGPEQFRFIEKIAALPKLRAVQWVFPKGEHPSEHLDKFKRIRGLGLSLLMDVKCVDDAVYLAGKLGPDGLFLSLPT
ncbi:MAG: hypothetical protein FWF03_06565, partial [Defluviitaleaceae bacterium]|nr:hypothetical protein [Defluviitaleaceae bacterium]